MMMALGNFDPEGAVRSSVAGGLPRACLVRLEHSNVGQSGDRLANWMKFAVSRPESVFRQGLCVGWRPFVGELSSCL